MGDIEMKKVVHFTTKTCTGSLTRTFFINCCIAYSVYKMKKCALFVANLSSDD